MNLFAIVSLKSNKAVNYASDKMKAKVIRDEMDVEARGDKQGSTTRYFKISLGPDHRNFVSGKYIS